jgi:hypothetical protein
VDNSKTLELEILITISQNKNVPIYHFQHLFEHKWKTYYPMFKELLSDEAFCTTTPITGLRSYELTPKGKSRITELIELRESEISARLSQLQHQRSAPSLNWKTIRARLTAFAHVWVSAEKTAHATHRSDYDNLKARIKRAKLIPHKA